MWLTSAKPWDPTSLEAPDEQVLPYTDGTSGDTVGTTLTLSTKGKKQPPDYDDFQERLGWLPLDTIQKTFDATTQLAGTIPLRLPLRRHIKSCFPQLNQLPACQNLYHGHAVQFDSWLGRHYLCATLCGKVQSFYLCLWHAD